MISEVGTSGTALACPALGTGTVPCDSCPAGSVVPLMKRRIIAYQCDTPGRTTVGACLPGTVPARGSWLRSAG
jgi:hypothetical protein